VSTKKSLQSCSRPLLGGDQGFLQKNLRLMTGNDKVCRETRNVRGRWTRRRKPCIMRSSLEREELPARKKTGSDCDTQIKSTAQWLPRKIRNTFRWSTEDRRRKKVGRQSLDGVRADSYSEKRRGSRRGMEDTGEILTKKWIAQRGREGTGKRCGGPQDAAECPTCKRKESRGPRVDGGD